ncbi:hypothetical protein Tco_0999860 [Tanacetum coccineum]
MSDYDWFIGSMTNLRQTTAFKSKRPRISKPRFASQVDVNNDLSKPVTTHHLPKGRESAPAKPHHMIAPSSSRYGLQQNKRQIPKARFSIKKTTTVHVKTTTPRSCLRWQPTGRILKTVCLRWVPTGKTFASSTTKVESEPPNGSMQIHLTMSRSRNKLLMSVQAPFLNVHMTFDRSRSSLGLHGNDVCSHQFRPRSSSNDF